MIDFGLGVQLCSLANSYRPYAWRNDPKIWRWTRQNDLRPLRAHEKWFDDQAHDPTLKMYEIWSKDAVHIGVCGLTSINWQNRNAEFSLYIAPEYQGKKLSKPALLTLFYHGFKNLGLKSIWGETFEGNHARRIFQDIGMKEDGIRRQFYWKDGKFWDAHMVSILDEEFFDKHGWDRSCFG